MKVLIHTYDTAYQNEAGGVHNRIERTVSALRKTGLEVDFFDKYKTNIKDYDILHIFKLDIGSKQLVDHAKAVGLKVVVSSIMSLNKGWLVDMYWMIKSIPIATIYKQAFSICSKSDHIIVETSKEALFMKKHYHINDKKISVVPNGIDDVSSKDELIYSLIGKNVPYALLLSRFDKNKNQLNVIKAVKGSDIEIVFIGGPDSSNKGYYDRCLKEAEGCDNIHFLGWLCTGDKLLRSALGNASAIICSSYQETFGISILEGLMAGATPVLSNTLPILEFETFKSCITFDPDNIKDIREKIKKAIYDEKDLDLIKKAKEEFSWESVAYKHLKIYQNLLHG
jgi:glycosyltransferase, family 1